MSEEVFANYDAQRHIEFRDGFEHLHRGIGQTGHHCGR